MKKLLAILSVTFFANQASANEEFLCNAWSYDFTNGKPFILKKVTAGQQLLQFKDPYGDPVTAKFLGKHASNYSIYISNLDKNGHRRIYYFADTFEIKDYDALLYLGYIDRLGSEATCYRQ